MQNKKISIIITFYNQEKFVDRTLKSVFDQTMIDDCQVIIGDDGSSDGTVEKLVQWKSKHDNLEYYVQERDKNGNNYPSFRFAYNRLFLLEKIETPYFAFLDGDDYWTDNHKLEMQYNILENSKNNDCVACGHYMTEVEETDLSEKLSACGIYEEKKIDVREYYSNYYVSTDTLMLRSEVLNKIDTSLLGESFDDNLITYSFLQYGKLYFIPKSMCVYWKHKGGLWTSSSEIQQIFKSIMEYDFSLLINKELKEVCKKRHEWYIFMFLKKKIRAKDIDKQLIDVVNAKKLKTCNRLLNRHFRFNIDMLNRWMAKYLY